MNNQRSFTPIIIVLIVVALLAGGILTRQYFGIPKEEAEKEAIENETADWNICVNKEYDFEVKYPKEWLKDAVPLFPNYIKEAVVSSPSCTFFVPKDKRIPEHVWISVSTFPCKTPSCDPREEMPAPYRKAIEQSTVEGRSIFIFDYKFEAERNLSYIVINDEKTRQGYLTLSIHHGRQTGIEYLPNKEIQPELNILNQMLSTFRFIEVEVAEEFFRVLQPESNQETTSPV